MTPTTWTNRAEETLAREQGRVARHAPSWAVPCEPDCNELRRHFHFPSVCLTCGTVAGCTC